MYDNLTADDIVDIWSRVHLDNSIAWAAYENRRRYEPPPLPFHFAVRLALQLEDERKRPFSQITYGCA